MSTSCHSSSSDDDEDFFDSIEPPSFDCDDDVNKEGKCSLKIESKELRGLIQKAHDKAHENYTKILSTREAL